MRPASLRLLGPLLAVLPLSGCSAGLKRLVGDSSMEDVVSWAPLHNR